MTSSLSSRFVPDGFGFYAILTAPIRGYDYCTRVLVDLEIPFVQLRMKHESLPTIVETAHRMRRITEKTATRLIINDFPEVARDVGADGVHVGQDDMDYAVVRDIVGKESIVGLSTHTPEQTRKACALGADYIGIGPVFPTPTKEKPDAAIGIEGMRTMLALATVPAVVLGSVTEQTIPAIRRGGAKNFSLVRPVNQSLNPRRVIQRLVHVWKTAGYDAT